MEFLCRTCGKKAFYETEIMFCPFCGAGYSLMNNHPFQKDSVRITIGSDSERNVENKYWLQIKSYIDDITDIVAEKNKEINTRIKRRIPHISIPFSLDELLDNEILTLEKKIERYISRVESKIIEIETCADSISQRGRELVDMVHQEEQENKDFLSGVAKVFHSDFYYKSCFDIDEVIDELEVKKLKKHSSEIYHSLLNSINDSFDSFVFTIKEHDINFAAGDIKSISYEEAFDVDPINLASELKTLSAKDYDFILGENPVPFQRAFWKAVVFLAYSINDLLDDICDDANGLPHTVPFDMYIERMIQGMKEALTVWKERADIHLDEIYKQQTIDMVLLFQQLSDLYQRRRT